MDFAEHSAQDARLTILRALQGETDGQLNESLLQHVLTTYGHNRPRAYVRTQLRYLETLGAVRIVEAGDSLIGILTQAGEDHIERRSWIEGVAKPSRR